MIDSSDVRNAYGVNAIRVRGDLVHPECRTDEECTWTVQFLRAHNGTCDRCGQSLAEQPGLTLAQRLKDLRKEREWSQEYLGHASGVHPTIVSKIEQRRRGATLDVLIRLARGMGLSVAQLLEGVSGQ